MAVKRRWLVLLTIAVAMAAAACTGQGVVSELPEISIKPDARLMTPQLRESASLDAVLSQLASAESLAAGLSAGETDPVVWQQLTAELARVLNARQAGKEISERPTGDENQLSDAQAVDDGQGGWLIEWSYVNVGDYDLNGEVGISDLTPIGQNFKAQEGDENWDVASLADGDGNGEVNVSDVTPIGVHFGVSCGGFNIYARNGFSGPFTFLDQVPRDTGTGGPRPQYSWPITGTIYEQYIVAAYDFAGDDRPIFPLTNENARIMEGYGLSIIDDFNGVVTVSGDASALAPGQVLVSGVGQGFLGKIESISGGGGTAEITYSQATFEDLFDYVEISFQRSIGFGDMQSYTPGYEGVVVEAASGASAIGDKGASIGGDFRIKLPDKELFAGLKLQGILDLSLMMDFDLQVGTGWEDFGSLQRIYWETECRVQATPVIAWKADAKLLDKAWMIAEINLNPIVFTAGPIPVVIIPQIEVYFGIKGTVEVGLEFKPTVWAEASAGLEYTPDAGWEPFGDYDYSWDIGLDKPNVYGKFEVEFDLFTPQPTMSFYGADGPYAKFFSPYGKIVGQLQTTPPEFSLTGWLGMKGHVGADVNALGWELANYESDSLFDVMLKVYEEKWPLQQHALTVTVQWEAESVEARNSVKDGRDRDRELVNFARLGWLYGAAQADGVDEQEPGSLDSEPYALWTNNVNYSDGYPQSGTTTMYVTEKVSEVYQPLLYQVYICQSDFRWPVIVKQISVSGSGISASRSFGPEYALYGGYYYMFMWDPETGDWVLPDPEGGSVTPLHPNGMTSNGWFPHLEE